MKPLELRQQCEHQLRLFGNYVEPNITLVQRERWGKSNTRKLLGVSGDIVQENADGTIVVLYPAKKLLEALGELEKEGS